MLLMALEQLGKAPLLPQISPKESEAALVLTRACLVVMQHNMDLTGRLVGQRVINTDMVQLR